MPKASCAARRRGRRKATGLPARLAGWSAAQSAPASAVRWAPFTACWEFPTAITIAAAASTTAPVISTATGDRQPSILDPVPGLEDPPHHEHAGREEGQRHADAQGHADIGDFIKAPAETGDQIDHRS